MQNTQSKPTISTFRVFVDKTDIMERWWLVLYTADDNVISHSFMGQPGVISSLRHYGVKDIMYEVEELTSPFQAPDEIPNYYDQILLGVDSVETII